MPTIINKSRLSYGMIESKRGQLAIFIVLAIVIVAVLLIVFLYPKFSSTGQKAFTPNSFLQGCLEPQLRPVIAQIAAHAGYISPNGTIEYNGQKVKYLCYTSEYYKTCVNQQPMIKENFENNLAQFVTNAAKQCMLDLKAEYERQQYAVTLGDVSAKASMVPGDIRVDIQAPMTVTKGDTQSFNSFEINMKSNMYDLVMIASSIIEFESTFGNSETTLYMQYYPNLKMFKNQLSDGTRIYTLNDVVTNESFIFASRSLAWPPGYTGQ